MNETNYIKATPGNRFLAFLADGLVSLLWAIPFGILAYIASELWGGGANAVVGLALAAGACSIIYTLIKDGLNDGRSTGKKWLKLSVVRLDSGEKCSIGKSVFRNLIWLATVIPVVGLLLFAAEAILTLANPQGKRIGDMLANTMVIETQNQ